MEIKWFQIPFKKNDTFDISNVYRYVFFWKFTIVEDVHKTYVLYNPKRKEKGTATRIHNNYFIVNN